jgi:hypothetical protein
MMSIRARREEAAVKELRAADLRLAEALAFERRALERLEEWRRHIEVESQRRWDALIGAKTSTKGLEEFRAGLAALSAREAELEAELNKAGRDVADRRADVAKAREELLARRRALEKLQRHRETWLAVEAAEVERQEGLEMEEFTRPAPTAAPTE